MRRIPLAGALAALALLPAPARAAGPACALLDPGRSPRAALLEAKLLADPGATWVERNQIDKALGEQKLQAAFGPQGVADRVKLGALLKADVLVLVREAGAGPDATLEVIVGETAGGLRLLTRAVPVTTDADADVAALLAAVRDGVRKYAEKVAAVVAVPPFVTKDLEFEHDHLKGAYARLTEAAALGRAGVVVVELEEAEAFAREFALAAPGAKLDRPPPVYLFGEYRNAGRGRDRTVALGLRAERGGKPLGKPSELTVKPDAAPAELRAWAAGVLDTLAKDPSPRPAADPKAEAKLLADRAMTFRRLGYRAETLALVEASLMLDPGQPALHLEAVRQLSAFVATAFNAAVDSKDPKRVAEFATAYRRALAHIEAYANTAGGPQYYQTVVDMERDFRHVARGLVVYDEYRAALEDEILKLREERREVYLRIVPVAAARPGGTPEAPFVWAAVRDLPRAERYAAVEAVVAKLGPLPHLGSRAAAYLSPDGQVPGDRPELRALLARWAASDKAYLREAAADLKARQAAPSPPFPGLPKPDTDPAAPGPGAVALKPVPLDVPNSAQTPLVGGLAVGPNADLLWTDAALYLMTEKGKPRAVWTEPAADRQDARRFSSIASDGKYVWAARERERGGPVLLVLDPAAGAVWDASAAEGLPKPPADGKGSFGGPALLACPLEPGRALLTGWFAGRLWVGVATLDPKAGAVTVKVTHEAREAPDPEDKEQWKKTTVGARPSFAFLLTGADGVRDRRVLIGRVGHGAFGLTEHPLVVRPDGVAEGVLADRVPNPPRQDTAAVIGGALHFLELHAEGDKISSRLARVGLPGPAKGVLSAGLPRSPSGNFRVVAHGGKAHAVIEWWEPAEPPVGFKRTAQWWTFDPDGKNPTQVATGLPGMRAVWTSANYGLVALVDHGMNAPPVLNAVSFVTPPPKGAAAAPPAVPAVPHTPVPPKVVAPHDPAPVPAGAGGREPVAGEERAFEVAPGVRMTFCYIPAGAARLGAPKAERARVVKAVGDDREPGWLRAEGEEARGAFETKGFWLGKYEVTQAEWRAVMGANPSYYDGDRENAAKGLDTARFPVERVSWDACQKFLTAVNGRPGAAAAFGRAGRFALPHENEWEYACRGGKGNDRAFYWGGELTGAEANVSGRFPPGAAAPGAAPGRTTAVGSYAKGWPHPWGLCDMHGNVWEWCDNEFDDVAELRVLRGGAHGALTYRARAAARNRTEPTTANESIGFRVCFRPAK